MVDNTMELETMFSDVQNDSTPQGQSQPQQDSPTPPQKGQQYQTPPPPVTASRSSQQAQQPSFTAPQPSANSRLSNGSASTLNSGGAKRDRVGDDFDIGMSDEMRESLLEAGADVGEIGMKVARVPIERYKGSASKIDRIGFISRMVIPVKYHYIPEKGYIMCFRGRCCELLGNPTIRYLFPIVVYQTDSEGNVSGGKISLMMLSAGEDLYKTIQTLHKGSANFGGIDHVDLLVTCQDEKYQKLSLVQAGPCIWRDYRAIAEFLREKWQKDGHLAYQAMARKVDEASFLKMMDMDVAPPNSSYDASNQDLSRFF